MNHSKNNPKTPTADEDVFLGLKQTRDEIMLHAHLMGAELKNQFEKLEEEWKILRRHLKQDESALKTSIDNVKQAAAPIAEDLRASYDRLLSQVRGTSKDEETAVRH